MKWCLTTLGFLLLDITSKLIVVWRMPYHEEAFVIPGFFRLFHTTNTGIAFSLLADAYPWKTALLAAVAVTVLVYVIWMVWTNQLSGQGTAIGLAMIAGGVVGNTSNRLLTGSVVDFLDFHIGRFAWPTFNLADSFISIGALSVLVGVLISERRQDA